MTKRGGWVQKGEGKDKVICTGKEKAVQGRAPIFC